MATDGDKPWHVPILPGFRRCGLSHTARDVMVALCGYARRRPYCWTSNAAIAEDTGLLADTVRAALRELERKEWIARPMEDCKRVRRVGVILLKRPDGLLNPVADDGPFYGSTLEDLKRDRARWQALQRPRRIRVAAGASPPSK